MGEGGIEFFFGTTPKITYHRKWD